jgi:hypothetical protein
MSCNHDLSRNIIDNGRKPALQVRVQKDVRFIKYECVGVSVEPRMKQHLQPNL